MGYGLSYARTMAFVGLGFLTVFNAYCSRSFEKSVLRMDPMGNNMLLLGMAGSVLSVLMVVYIPFMQSIFHTVPIASESWILIVAAGFLVVVASETMKRLLPGLQ
jgi:Ca2+-transporting ATPase